MADPQKRKKKFKRQLVAVYIHPTLVAVIDTIADARGADRSDELRRIIELRAMKYAMDHPEQHPEAANLARLFFEDVNTLEKG